MRRALSRHLVDDVVDARLGEARHQLVDDLLHEEVRHTRTAALGELKRRPQVDNIGGISVPVVVVGVLMSIARYLKARKKQLR